MSASRTGGLDAVEHARRRRDAEDVDIGAARREAGHQCRFEHRPRDAWVPPQGHPYGSVRGPPRSQPLGASLADEKGDAWCQADGLIGDT